MSTFTEQLFGKLARQPGFLKFWASDSISLFGAQITLLALPLTAVILLRATPAQMGLLVALETLPIVLFSLHAGAIIDRCRKLRLLKLAAVSRGLLLLLIPLATYFDFLRIEILLAVGFLVASQSVFADVAYQALVVKLVAREQLIDANAKIGLSESSAGIAGPSLGALLVQWLTAPFAVLLEAFAFFVAARLLNGVKLQETVSSADSLVPTLTSQIREGLRAVWQNSVLRWTAALLALWQFLNHVFLATFVLFAVRDVGLEASMVGVAFSMSGVGFLLGSLCVKSVSARIGLGATLLSGMWATAIGWTAVGLAGSGVAAMVSLSLAFICEGLGTGLFFLTYITLRQGMTAEALLGRVISTMRFFTVAAAPLGALLAGALGEALGSRPMLLLVGAGGAMLCLTATLRSPLKRLKAIPEPSVGLPALDSASAVGGNA
jgi:predicted MFS family arabinose efflux permease